jgi:hypothetical protein
VADPDVSSRESPPPQDFVRNFLNIKITHSFVMIYMYHKKYINLRKKKSGSASALFIKFVHLGLNGEITLINLML